MPRTTAPLTDPVSAPEAMLGAPCPSTPAEGSRLQLLSSGSNLGSVRRKPAGWESRGSLQKTFAAPLCGLLFQLSRLEGAHPEFSSHPHVGGMPPHFQVTPRLIS
jgi:hypothetical protein